MPSGALRSRATERRLRVRTSPNFDFEWDFDFDTCSSSVLPALINNPIRPCGSKFTADNVYVDVHRGNVIAGLGYARLNAPALSRRIGREYEPSCDPDEADCPGNDK